MRSWGAALTALFFLAGCSGWMVSNKDEGAKELERSFKDSESHVKENRTRSALGALETAVGDYVKAEGRIPEDLSALIPKYLAEIPSVDLDVPRHQETNAVKIYPSSILRDGLIDGTKLADTGKWGYVHNERQVVVFVDCTHPSSRGRPWYQERP